MKKKLLLCPFCNSKSEFAELDDGLFCVRCTKCNASVMIHRRRRDEDAEVVL